MNAMCNQNLYYVVQRGGIKPGFLQKSGRNLPGGFELGVGTLMLAREGTPLSEYATGHRPQPIYLNFGQSFAFQGEWVARENDSVSTKMNIPLHPHVWGPYSQATFEQGLWMATVKIASYEDADLSIFDVTMGTTYVPYPTLKEKTISDAGLIFRIASKHPPLLTWVEERFVAAKTLTLDEITTK